MENQSDDNETSLQANREDVDRASTRPDEIHSQPSTVPAIRAEGRARKAFIEADVTRARKQRLNYLNQFEVADLALWAEHNRKTLESLLIDQSYAAQRTAALLLRFADGEADPKQMDVGYKHAANFMRLSIDAALAANTIKRGGRQKVVVQRFDINQGAKAQININKHKGSSEPES